MSRAFPATRTPGPWKVSADEPTSTDLRPAWSIDAPDWGELAVVYGNDDSRSNEEGRANAEFIVRACNSHDALLNACKDLVDRFDRKATSKQSLGCSYSEAKAAIAKAEGR